MESRERNLATDLDALITKGYPESDAKNALRLAEGDLNQALLILRDSGKRDTSWMKETLDQWVDNVPKYGLPQSAESRALWKSPIYARVGSWTRLGEDGNKTDQIFYVLNVIMRDARQWSLRKTYQEFYNFWMSLPFGTGSKFQSSFPQTGIFLLFSMTDEQIENRRIQLEEWIRELCLNEECMTNPKILQTLYDFVKENEHKSNNLYNDESNSHSDLSLSNIPTQPAQMSFHNRLSSYLKLTRVPLSLLLLTRQLPCYINTMDIPGIDMFLVGATKSTSQKDVSDEQLAKDLERDRIIINNKRLLGAIVDLETILKIATKACEACFQSKQLTIPNHGYANSYLRSFCRLCLQQASRTESAFLSHTGLTLVLDLFSHPEYLIVPESNLAQPISLFFSLIPTPDNLKQPSKPQQPVQPTSPAGKPTPPPISALVSKMKAKNSASPSSTTLMKFDPVSYTHLTLPTIYSV